MNPTSLPEALERAFASADRAKRDMAIALSLATASPNRPRDEAWVGSVQAAISAHPFVCEGGHDCAHSLTGRCWYNSAEDPAHDSCFWCGEPEERK